MNSSFSRQQGAAFVLVVLSLIPIFALAAFAIDVNYILYERTRLQGAADAGALAGIVKLPNKDDAIAEAINVVKANYDPESKYLSNDKDDQDIIVTTGCWTFSLNGTEGSFDNTCSDANALRVVVNRSSIPVKAFFGHLLGFKNYELANQAIAYLGGSRSSIVCAAICKDAYDDHIASGDVCLTIIVPTHERNNNVRRINEPDQDKVEINMTLRTFHGNINCLDSEVVNFALIEISESDCSSSSPVVSSVKDIFAVNYDTTTSCAEFSASSLATAVLVN